MATINVIRSVSGFQSLKNHWRELVQSNPQARVFQTFEWNFHGWRLINCQDRRFQLFILHAKRDGHAEEAIFPFCIDGSGILRFIAESVGDTLDAVYAKHNDSWHTFYHDVARFIAEQSEVKGISLAKLDSQSEILAYFKLYCPRTIIEHYDTYSVFSTPKGADVSSSFPQLNSEERSYLHSVQKKFCEYAFNVYSKANAEVFPREKIVRLRDWMVQQGLRVMAACPDDYIDLMSEMYDCGLCEVAVFERGNDFALVSFRLIEGHHVNFWIVLYKDPAMTTAADVRYVFSKMPYDNWDFDFGTGAYAYKLGTFRPNVFHLYRLRSRSLTFGNFVREITQVTRRHVKAWLVGLKLVKPRK